MGWQTGGASGGCVAHPSRREAWGHDDCAPEFHEPLPRVDTPPPGWPILRAAKGGVTPALGLAATSAMCISASRANSRLLSSRFSKVRNPDRALSTATATTRKNESAPARQTAPQAKIFKQLTCTPHTVPTSSSSAMSPGGMGYRRNLYRTCAHRCSAIDAPQGRGGKRDGLPLRGNFIPPAAQFWLLTQPSQI